MARISDKSYIPPGCVKPRTGSQQCDEARQRSPPINHYPFPYRRLSIYDVCMCACVSARGRCAELARC